MKGLGLRAPGANPLLQLSLAELPTADPFFYALGLSFSDMKTLVGREIGAPLLTQAVDSLEYAPGPAGVLLNRANSVSISWNRDLGLFEDLFGVFCLWETSLLEVQSRLVRAWQDAVQHHLSHRVTFAGLENADPQLTGQVVRTFSVSEQALLRLSLNGTFYTKAFSPAQFAALPDAQLLHGWAMRVPQELQVRRMLAATVQDFQSFEPVPVTEVYDLFTDGSCLRPKTPQLRVAAWAVNVALPGLPASSLP